MSISNKALKQNALHFEETRKALNDVFFGVNDNISTLIYLQAKRDIENNNVSEKGLERLQSKIDTNKSCCNATRLINDLLVSYMSHLYQRTAFEKAQDVCRYVYDNASSIFPKETHHHREVYKREIYKAIDFIVDITYPDPSLKLVLNSFENKSLIKDPIALDKIKDLCEYAYNHNCSVFKEDTIDSRYYYKQALPKRIDFAMDTVYPNDPSLRCNNVYTKRNIHLSIERQYKNIVLKVETQKRKNKLEELYPRSKRRNSK